MAIQWTEYGPNSDRTLIKRTWTSHEGLVVGPTTTREVQIMSDVYCDASYVQVWNSEKGHTEQVCLGQHIDLCSILGMAVPDAPVEIQAEAARQAAEAQAAAQAAQDARWAAEAKAMEEALRNTPEPGKVMVVTRGRKVPIGTVGKVFWVRDGRVGLALDDTKDARGRSANVAWVDAAYLKAA